MQRSNMPRYLFENAVLGFLASDDSKEISNSDWISTDHCCLEGHPLQVRHKQDWG